MVRSRVLLAVLAVVALALAMVPGWGVFYTPVALAGVLAALVLGLAACGREANWPWTPPHGRLLVAGAAAVLTVEAACLLWQTLPGSEPAPNAVPAWVDGVVAATALAVACLT